MKFDDPSQKTVKPVMTHFFYMDKTDPIKVSRSVGSVGQPRFRAAGLDVATRYFASPTNLCDSNFRLADK